MPLCSAAMTPKFDHEKLRVYELSLTFVSWSTDLIFETTMKAAVKDQLDRASTSVPLNIAEGNAKWTAADRGKFLKIAMGSTMECAACLDVFVAKRLCERERVADGKRMLFEVASMLGGLMRSIDDRIAEDAPVYGRGEHEQEQE